MNWSNDRKEITLRLQSRVLAGGGGHFGVTLILGPWRKPRRSSFAGLLLTSAGSHD